MLFNFARHHPALCRQGSLEGGCCAAAAAGRATMVDEATLDLVRAHMQEVRVPAYHDKVRAGLLPMSCTLSPAKGHTNGS